MKTKKPKKNHLELKLDLKWQHKLANQRRHFSTNNDAVAQESFGIMLLLYQSTPASLLLDQRNRLLHAGCLVCPD